MGFIDSSDVSVGDTILVPVLRSMRVVEVLPSLPSGEDLFLVVQADCPLMANEGPKAEHIASGNDIQAIAHPIEKVMGI